MIGLPLESIQRTTGRGWAAVPRAAHRSRPRARRRAGGGWLIHGACSAMTSLNVAFAPPLTAMPTAPFVSGRNVSCQVPLSAPSTRTLNCAPCALTDSVCGVLSITAHAAALGPLHDRDDLIPVRELDAIAAVRARAQHEARVEPAVAERRVRPRAPTLAEEAEMLRWFRDGDGGRELRVAKLLRRTKRTPLLTAQRRGAIGDDRALPVSGC